MPSDVSTAPQDIPQKPPPEREPAAALFRSAYDLEPSQDNKSNKSTLKPEKEKEKDGSGSNASDNNGEPGTAAGTATGAKGDDPAAQSDTINQGLKANETEKLYGLSVAALLGDQTALALLTSMARADKADPSLAVGDSTNNRRTPVGKSLDTGITTNNGGAPKATAAKTGNNDPASPSPGVSEPGGTDGDPVFVSTSSGYYDSLPPETRSPERDRLPRGLPGEKLPPGATDIVKGGTVDRTPPSEKEVRDRPIDRTPPPAAKFDSNGRRLNTSTEINGVGRVDFEATRGSDKQVTALDMKIGGSKFSFAKGEDGNWNFKPTPGQKPTEADLRGAQKALDALGIKPDGKGSFKGNLDITTEGKVRYQDSDKPNQKVSYLAQDGSTSKYDYGNYTRTSTDKTGNKSVEAWNGKAFVPIVGNVKETNNADGSITYTSTLKHGTNLTVERTTHPNDPSRDETKFTKRNGDGTAGEVSNYKWLEGSKTTNGKTTYLDDSTGKYREGKKEGNTVTFSDRDPHSRASSVTRDTKTGIVTYNGPGGFELQKNMKTDQVISSKTAAGHYKFSYDSNGGKDGGAVSSFTLNGDKFTRVSPNREGTNHQIALGRKTLGDFQPKTKGELNEYRNERTNEIVKMSLAVGPDGTVKVAKEGKDGKLSTQESRPEVSFTPEKTLAAAKEQLKVKTDENGKAIEYQHKDANLKLTKTNDGWKAEALDPKKGGVKELTKFQKDVYTNEHLDEAQKLNLLKNSKTFDGMSNFTDKQKKEVYQHADRLLKGRDDSALPAKEKAALADQLFSQIVNNNRNDQGRNNTCNVTVLRTMALKERPEVVAKLAADVANDGQFNTSDGKTIKVPMDSVRVRPGSPEATFPPADGARSALGKLWDVATINAVKQHETGGVTYKEVAPTERADTGGRLVREGKDGKTEVLYSKPRDGGERPYDSPAMSAEKIADAWKHLTGDSLSGRFLTHANRNADHKDLHSGKISNKEQLHKALTDGTAGGKSLIIGGNTGDLHKVAHNLKTRPEGGEHVWMVTGYDPKTKEVTVQNSWGKGNDIKMSLDSLYNTMQAPSPNKRGSAYWKPVR